MSIDRELLNNQLLATVVHTGVYKDSQSHTCVVVRVKDRHIHYMHFRDCIVQLEESFTEKFLADYPVELYRYPALRALRKMAHYIEQGFAVTPQAKTVLRSILKS